LSLKIEKLFEIIDFLLSEGKVTSMSIANKFNISRKTVSKYLIELTVFCPIDTYEGHGGGIEINKSFTLGGRYWNKNELEIIYKALLFYREANKDNTELEKIIKKFTAIGLEDDRKYIQKH